MQIVNVIYILITIIASLMFLRFAVEFFGRALWQTGYDFFYEISLAAVCLELAITTICDTFFPNSAVAQFVYKSGFATIFIVGMVAGVQNRDLILRR